MATDTNDDRAVGGGQAQPVYILNASMPNMSSAQSVTISGGATVFKVVALLAGIAETTIWTPAAGKKFRLMGFLLTAGAASTLTFKDGTGGTTIFAARGATDIPIATPASMANGILSATAGNPLTVTRGSLATLDGVVFGTEE